MSNKLAQAIEEVKSGTGSRTAQQIADLIGCSEATVRAARQIVAQSPGFKKDWKRGRRESSPFRSDPAIPRQQTRRQLRGVLSKLEEYGGTSAHALAKMMDIPHARMIRLLRVLTEAGLVTAGRGPDRLYRVPE